MPPEIAERLLSSWGAATQDVGQKFGTIGSACGDVTAEVTTYWLDSYEAGPHKPKVDFGRTLEGDLSRRDFTVNAMAIQLPEFELVDPCDGPDDLVGRALRTPVTAVQSFDDDPLRIMRAAYLAAQLEFDVGKDAVSAMTEMTERLATVSVKRIRAELKRLMLSPASRRGIEPFVYAGVADIVLPEITQLHEAVDEHKRHKDVHGHTLTVVNQAIVLEDPASKEEYEAYLLKGRLEGPDLTLRLTALFHDVGRPRTRRFKKDGSVTFRAHDAVGVCMAAKWMTALRFDKQMEKDVARLAELHLRVFGFSEAGQTDSAVRRFVRDTGDLLSRLIRLIRADMTSQNRRKVSRLQAGNGELTACIRDLTEQETPDAVWSDLGGARIMEIFGLKPGPEVGAARNYLPELRLDKGPLGEEEAECRLLTWWSERNSGVKNSIPAASSAPSEP